MIQHLSTLVNSANIKDNLGKIVRSDKGFFMRTVPVAESAKGLVMNR